MNSSTRLSELFKISKTLETQELINFKEEIRRINKDEKARLEKSDLIKHFKKVYSEYTISILQKKIYWNLLITRLIKRKSNIWQSTLISF